MYAGVVLTTLGFVYNGTCGKCALGQDSSEWCVQARMAHGGFLFSPPSPMRAFSVGGAPAAAGHRHSRLLSMQHAGGSDVQYSRSTSAMGRKAGPPDVHSSAERSGIQRAMRRVQHGVQRAWHRMLQAASFAATTTVTTTTTTTTTATTDGTSTTVVTNVTTTGVSNPVLDNPVLYEVMAEKVSTKFTDWCGAHGGPAGTNPDAMLASGMVILVLVIAVFVGHAEEEAERRKMAASAPLTAQSAAAPAPPTSTGAGPHPTAARAATAAGLGAGGADGGSDKSAGAETLYSAAGADDLSTAPLLPRTHACGKVGCADGGDAAERSDSIGGVAEATKPCV